MSRSMSVFEVIIHEGVDEFTAGVIDKTDDTPMSSSLRSEKLSSIPEVRRVQVLNYFRFVGLVLLTRHDPEIRDYFANLADNSNPSTNP